MILFLDFDGVLHPFPMSSANSHFSAASSLWKLLEKIPDLSVVITSTWRERYSFEELVEQLENNGGRSYAERFIGVTPIMESTTDFVPGIRQIEIESWLVKNKSMDEPYIILDDIERYFGSACRNLYLVDGTTGLTEHDTEMIPLWMRLLK